MGLWCGRGGEVGVRGWGWGVEGGKGGGGGKSCESVSRASSLHQKILKL